MNLTHFSNVWIHSLNALILDTSVWIQYMEMVSKKVRCNYCGVQVRVPRNAQAIQCLLCQSVIYVQSQSSISHAAIRIKDLVDKASSNINVMLASGNNNSGSGTLVSGYQPQPTRPSSNSGSVPLVSSYQPQPTRPSAPLIPFSAHGRKRAVLCGVSYNGQRHKLLGTVNDVKCMRFFLIQKLGFPSDCILSLTEEDSNPSLIPTKNNIRKAMQWLVQGCQSGDSLIFHYSGHGSQQLDFNRDEVDGHDEMIWPVDHEREGKILDDEINATIVRPLPQGARLHAIVDACHSGTILDLPFVCRVNRDGYYIWEDHGRMSSIFKGTSGGLAISFSACDDHQVSADTTAFSGNVATGALTYSFIQAVQNEPGLSYGRLINSMRRKIAEVKEGFLSNGPISSLVKHVLSSRLSQVPQLSSSETFDINSKQFAV